MTPVFMKLAFRVAGTFILARILPACLNIKSVMLHMESIGENWAIFWRLAGFPQKASVEIAGQDTCAEEAVSETD